MAATRTRKKDSPMAQARKAAQAQVTSDDGGDSIDTRGLRREGGAVIIDAADIMSQLAALTEKVGSLENQNHKLQAQLDSAERNGFYMDEFGNRVACLNSRMQQDNLNNHDKPGTLLEKLDVMEKQARIRKEPFDRERTRKILLGEPVEDLSIICPRCGRSDAAWTDDESKYRAHIAWHKGGGKKAAYPSKKNIRAVDDDEDDDED